MHFIIYTKDKPGALEVRKANRDAHLAFLNQEDAVKVCVAGPLLSSDGQIMIGSTLVVEAESLDIVKDWITQDPYAKAGLTGELNVHPYIWVIGKP